MESNNFLYLPVGMTDSRNRSYYAEDSGYYSYETPIHCLYHLFDMLSYLRSRLKEVNVWMITQLMITRPFSAAWDERLKRNNNLYSILGRGMFALDERHVYDIVYALSMGCPSQYRLTRGEVTEEWRLYCAKGGEL